VDVSALMQLNDFPARMEFAPWFDVVVPVGLDVKRVHVGTSVGIRCKSCSVESW